MRESLYIIPSVYIYVRIAGKACLEWEYYSLSQLGEQLLLVSLYTIVYSYMYTYCGVYSERFSLLVRADKDVRRRGGESSLYSYEREERHRSVCCCYCCLMRAYIILYTGRDALIVRRVFESEVLALHSTRIGANENREPFLLLLYFRPDNQRE